MDENDTVGTFRTIECRTIAHHSHLLNVVGIDVRQDVIEESVVQHGTAILLINDNIIDNNDRLCIDIQRVESLNEHHAADAGRTIALLRVDHCAKLLLHLFLDVHGIGVLEVAGSKVVQYIDLSLILATECCGIQARLLLLLVTEQTLPDRVVVRRSNVKGRSKHGCLQQIGAVVFCKGTVAIQTVSLHNGTCYGLPRSSIHDEAANRPSFILILLLNDGTFTCRLFLVVCIILGRNTEWHGKERQTQHHPKRLMESDRQHICHISSVYLGNHNSFHFSLFTIHSSLFMWLQDDTVDTHGTCVRVVALLCTSDITLNLQRYLWLILFKAIGSNGEHKVLGHLDIVHFIGLIHHSGIVYQGHTLAVARLNYLSVLSVMVEGELQTGG